MGFELWAMNQESEILPFQGFEHLLYGLIKALYKVQSPQPIAARSAP